MFKVLPPTAFCQDPLLGHLPARSTLGPGNIDPARDPQTGLAILKAGVPTKADITRFLFPSVKSGEKIVVLASPTSTLPLDLYHQYGALKWADSTSVDAATVRHHITEEGQIIHVPITGRSIPLPETLTASARLVIYGGGLPHNTAPDRFKRLVEVVAECLLPGGEFRRIVMTDTIIPADLDLIGALKAAGLSAYYYPIKNLETVAPTATIQRQSWTGMLVAARKPDVAKKVVVAPAAKAPPVKPPPAAVPAPVHPLLSWLPERGAAMRYADPEVRSNPHPNLGAISLEDQSTLAMLVFPQAPRVRVQPPKIPQVVILADGSAHDVANHIGTSYLPIMFGNSEPAITILGNREESWTESQLTQLHTMGIRLVHGSFIDFDRFRGQHRGTASLFLVFDAQRHDHTVIADYANTILAPGGELRLILTDDGQRDLDDYLKRFTAQLSAHERYDVKTVRVRLPNWTGRIVMASRPDPVAQMLGEMGRGGLPDTYVPSIAQPLDNRFGFAPDRMVASGMGSMDPNGRDRTLW